MAADLPARVQAAYRDPGLAVLEGFHPLKHALRFGAEVLCAVTPDPALPLALARTLAPELEQRLADLLEPVPEALFARLARVPPETGVLAIARRPAVATAELLAPRRAPIVLLDRPAHPGNVGAVVRVAAAAGAAAVLTVGGADPWLPGALRGAAGLHFALPVLRLDALPPAAGPLVAIEPLGQPLDEAEIPEGAVLAFGSERRGLDPAWRAGAALHLAIPMRSGVSSLNLATAVAVVLYAWRRQAALAGAGATA